MTKTLSWHRSGTTGNYVAVDEDREVHAAYSVGRDKLRPTGRQWYVETWPVSDLCSQLGPVQRRTGFNTMATAKEAAVRTHCFRCGQWREFADVECERADRNWDYKSWKCRDSVSCEAEVARRDALFAQVPARKGHNVFEVRETEDGPDLVVGRAWENTLTGREDGHSTVLGLTDTDLVKLEALLQRRRQNQAARLLLDRQGPKHTVQAGMLASTLRGSAVFEFTPAEGVVSWGVGDTVRLVSSDEGGEYFYGHVTYVGTNGKVSVRVLNEKVTR